VRKANTAALGNSSETNFRESRLAEVQSPSLSTRVVHQKRTFLILGHLPKLAAGVKRGRFYKGGTQAKGRIV
jgi:hypothetical protein